MTKKGGQLLRLALRALQWGLSFPAKPSSGGECWYEEGGAGDGDDDGGEGGEGSVPEGHFVVVTAAREEEPRRFVVSLRCLSHPRFLELLARAEEEFGFHQRGPLAIPCRSCELESILGDL